MLPTASNPLELKVCDSFLVFMHPSSHALNADIDVMKAIQ
jgi:hypothetical protein